MLTEKSKISTHQVLIMFALTVLSPAIRLFPSICALGGGAAGWIAPVISVAAPLIALAVLHALFKSGKPGSLADAFDMSLGRIAGRILLALYLVWTVILFLVYVRYYAERIVSSLFPNTNPDFFIITMLALVLFVARGELKYLARFSEIALLIFAVVFALFFASLLPTFKAENVLPVTYHDALPVMRSSYPIVSIFGYITLFFFFGDYVKDKRDIRKRGVPAVLLLAGFTALMLLLVIGSLGPDAASRMPLPFFKVSKLINIMQSFDRFEAVLLSVWVVADFILIAVFAFLIMNIAKKLFALPEAKHLASPIAMLGYAGGILIATSRFELEKFSESYAAHAVNLAFCIGIPAAALAIGKLRRRL